MVNKKKILEKMRKRMPGEIEVEFNKKGTEIKKIIRPNKEENKKKYNRYYV